MNYIYTKKINLPFSETLDKIRDAFVKEGFGVASIVDIADKIRNKVDPNFGEYIIFGICNPDFSHKYLSIDMDMGVFMPCSVAIYEKNNEVYVSTGIQNIMISGLVDNTNIINISNEISEIMKGIINGIG